MLDEFFAHADAGILDGEFKGGIACGRTRLLCDPHSDDSACSSVFDGIAEQVQEHLVQTQPVAVDFLVDDVHGIDVQLQLFGADVGQDDVAQAVQDVRQAVFLLVQVHLAAFDAAHVQDIVDQAQQMIA